MLLSKISLTNFKKHKHLVVDLTSGLNTIQGPNYAGKSTIQQAILYALFGTAVVPGKGEGIITKGATEKVAVVLEFSLGYKEYKLTRKGSEATLADGEGVISRSASAVNKEIEKLMGLSKDQLLKTRVSKQGDAHALLSTGTQELKKLVEILSGCEVVDKINKKAGVELKASTDKIDALTSTFDMSVNLVEFGKQVEALWVREREYLKLKATAETKKSVARAELRDADTQLTEVKAKHKLYTEAVNTRNLAEASVLSLTTQLEGLENNPLLLDEEDYTETLLDISEMEEAKLANERLETLKEQAEKELLEAIKNLNKVETELAKLVAVVPPSYVKPLIGLNLLLVTAKDSEVEAKTKLHTLQNQAVDGVCSGCKRPLGEMTLEEIAEHKRELKEAQSAFDLAAKTVRGFNRDITNMEMLQGEFDTYNDLVAKKNVKFESSLQHKILAEKKVIDFGEVLAYDSTDLHHATKAIGNHTVIAKQISSTTPLLMAAKQKLNAVVVPAEPNLSEAEDIRKEKDALLQEASNNLYSLMDDFGSITAEATDKQENYTKYLKVHQKVSELHKESEGYKAIVKVIKDNRAKMMEGIWAGLLEEASQFVNICTSGDVSGVSVDDKFNLTYKEGEYDFPIDNASGAQKSLIGLGIRLAITNMLPSNVDFILVDEVTADMTSDISAIAMSVVRTKCQQTIAVSHREQDLMASDNIISLGA